MDIKNYSAENREKIHKILKIFVDSLELTNRSDFGEVPLNVFEREGFSYGEVITTLKKIGRENKLIKNKPIIDILDNSYIEWQIFSRRNGEKELSWRSRVGSFLLVHGLSSEKDIYKCIFYTLQGFEKFILLAKKILRQIEKYNRSYKTVNEELIYIKLPPKTKWQDITLEFKDKYNVIPIVKGKKFGVINFAQMGFLDTRSPEKMRAKASWEKLLKHLALEDGSYNVTRDENIHKDDYKKQKQEIRRNFSKVFGIEEDPFYEFDGTTYKTKVRLIWFE